MMPDQEQIADDPWDLAEILRMAAETIRKPSDIDVLNRSAARTLEVVADDIESVHAGMLSVRRFCTNYGLKRKDPDK